MKRALMLPAVFVAVFCGSASGAALTADFSAAFFLGRRGRKRPSSATAGRWSSTVGPFKRARRSRTMG
jgi:hypothetical protein